MPRRHHRSSSCDSLSVQTIAVILDSSGKLSDLSSSLYSADSLSSLSTPDCCDYAIMTSLRRNATFPGHYMSQAVSCKAHQQRALNRWDSWAGRTPNESPKKPNRKIVEDNVESRQNATAPTTPKRKETPRKELLNAETSRWCSHSESSRAPTLTPRRSLSPSRTVSAVPHEQDNKVDTQSNTPPFQKNTDTSDSKRCSRKAHNRLLPESSPNRPPIDKLSRLDTSRARRVDAHARCTTTSIEYEFTHKLGDLFSSYETFVMSTTMQNVSGGDLVESSTASLYFSVPCYSCGKR